MRTLQGAGAQWMFGAGQAGQGPPRAKASAWVRLPAWVGSQLHGDASLRHKLSSLSLCKSAFTAFFSFLPFRPVPLPLLRGMRLH